MHINGVNSNTHLLKCRQHKNKLIIKTTRNNNLFVKAFSDVVNLCTFLNSRIHCVDENPLINCLRIRNTKLF